MWRFATRPAPPGGGWYGTEAEAIESSSKEPAPGSARTGPGYHPRRRLRAPPPRRARHPLRYRSSSSVSDPANSGEQTFVTGTLHPRTEGRWRHPSEQVRPVLGPGIEQDTRRAGRRRRGGRSGRASGFRPAPRPRRPPPQRGRSASRPAAAHERRNGSWSPSRASATPAKPSFRYVGALGPQARLRRSR